MLFIIAIIAAVIAFVVFRNAKKRLNKPIETQINQATNMLINKLTKAIPRKAICKCCDKGVCES